MSARARVSQSSTRISINIRVDAAWPQHKWQYRGRSIVTRSVILILRLVNSRGVVVFAFLPCGHSRGDYSCARRASGIVLAAAAAAVESSGQVHYET